MVSLENIFILGRWQAFNWHLLRLAVNSDFTCDNFVPAVTFYRSPIIDDLKRRLFGSAFINRQWTAGREDTAVRTLGERRCNAFHRRQARFNPFERLWDTCQ